MMLAALLGGRWTRGCAALALAALLLAGAYVRGREAGVRAEQGRTASEHRARVAAEALQATLAGQLRQQNAATDAAVRAAKAQQAHAQQLAADLSSTQAAAAKDEAQWRARWAAATVKPECRALQEDLCDSVLDY